MLSANKLISLYFLLSWSLTACKADAPPAEVVPTASEKTEAPPATGAAPCDSPEFREAYESDKRMQMTSDPFDLWCNKHLAAEAERKELRQRMQRAATAPAEELCAWPEDKMGGPRYYVAVRADRLEGRPVSELPDPLASYLRVEKFERYAGSKGLEMAVDALAREVPDTNAEFSAVKQAADTLGLEDYAAIAEKLAGNKKPSPEDWKTWEAAFTETSEKKPLAAVVADKCVELVQQIDRAAK